MEYYAHKRELQKVSAHLQKTADRAAECLGRCGLSQGAFLAGLLHDMGKFSADYQDYLLRGNGTRGAVIHSFQGCRFLLERYHDTPALDRRLTAELLAFAVGAHHGLFDCVDQSRKLGLRYRLEKENLPYHDAVNAYLTACMDLPALDRCFDRAAKEVGAVRDLGNEIFVQMEERCDDGCKNLSERAATIKGIKDKDAYAKIACEKWMDVRSFGQVFAFKSTDKSGVSVGVRGPVSIHQAVSISPVEVESMQITKSVNGNPDKKSDNAEPEEKRSSDTMGMKHFVRFGLYEFKGSINVQLAEKTGFTQEDAETVKECLRTLFVNDASAARPDGSMEVYRLYWWEHNCRDGQYSSAAVHRSVHVVPKDTAGLPAGVEDYDITLDEMPGLTPEIIYGL